MQYIQLQAQVASQVPTSGVGNFNLFLDVNDKLIKVKDDAGNYYTYSDITTVTNTELDALITSSGLTVGLFYYITGVNTGLYGGTDIVLQAITSNKLTQKGYGVFYNPNYDNYSIWSNISRLDINYNSITGVFNIEDTLTADNGAIGYLYSELGYESISFIEVSGDWSTASYLNSSSGGYADINFLDLHRTYTQGDKVIWGQNVWVNNNDNVGNLTSNLDLDNEWTVVPYNTSDYNISIDEIEYEYEFDNISYRKSGSNVVTSNWLTTVDYWGHNSIGRFPWGNSQVYNCEFNNTYMENIINFRGSLYQISTENQSSFNIINSDLGSEIYNIKLYESSGFYNIYIGSNSEIYNMVMYANSEVSDIFVGDSYGASTRIDNIVVNESALLGTVKVICGSRLQRLNLGLDSFNVDFYLKNSYMRNVQSGVNTEISDINLRDDCYLTNINLGVNSSLYTIDLSMSSNFNDVNVGTNSYVGDISLNDNCDFNKVELLNNCYIENINLTNNYGAFNTVLLMNDSYIANIYLYGLYQSFYNIKLDNSSHIQNIYFEFDNQSFGHIDLSNQSNIYNISLNNNDVNFDNFNLTNASYIQNVNLNGSSSFFGHGKLINSHVNGLTLSGDSSAVSYLELENGAYLQGININGVNGLLRDIKLSNQSYITSLSLGGANTYLTKIELDMYSYLNTINLNFNNSFISEIKLGVYSYFNNITLDSTSCYINKIDGKNNSYLEDITSNFPYNYISNIGLDNSARINGVTFNNANNNISFSTLGRGSYISNVTFNAQYCELSKLNLNILSYLNTITFNGDTSSVIDTEFGVESYIQSLVMSNNSLFQYNNLGNGSYMLNLTLGISSIMSGNKLNQFSWLYNVNLNDTIYLNNIELGIHFGVSNKTIATSATEKLIGIVNNYPLTLDISGLSTIDLSSVDFAGIINLVSSNSTESVTSIINYDGRFPIQFQPANFLTVTFNGASVATISDNQLALPTATFVANGTHNDFITVEKISGNTSTFLRQTVAQNYL